VPYADYIRATNSGGAIPIPTGTRNFAQVGVPQRPSTAVGRTFRSTSPLTTILSIAAPFALEGAANALHNAGILPHPPANIATFQPDINALTTRQLPYEQTLEYRLRDTLNHISSAITGRTQTPTQNQQYFRDIVNQQNALTCSLFGTNCATVSGDDNAASPNLPGTPPFFGGQSVGIYYRVTGSYQLRADGFNDGNWTSYNFDTNSLAALPPNTGYRGAILGFSEAQLGEWYELYLDNSLGQKLRLAAVFNANPNRNAAYRNMVITSITRQDGQADTGGNIAAAPSGNSSSPTASSTPGSNRNVIAPPVFIPNSPGINTPDNPRDQPRYPVVPPNTPSPPGTPNPPPDSPNGDDNGGLNVPNITNLLPPIPGRANPTSPNQIINTGVESSPNQGLGTPTSIDTPSSVNCRYDSSNIKGDTTAMRATLESMNTLLNGTILTKVNTIDSKLGDTPIFGGISGILTRAWDSNLLTRATNLLILVGVWHNALMLSNNVLQTLFAATTNILEAFEITLKNSAGDVVSINEIVNNAVEDLFKNIFGDETVEEVQRLYQKSNRAIQAASNIINSMRSIFDTINSALEEISENTGKIGNALRKWGVVGQNSYSIMRENVDYQQGRFWRFMNGAQQGASSLEEVTSSILEVTEEVNSIREQSEEFTDARDAVIDELAARESESKDASVGAIITREDEIGG
jgi:hypothetical protein